MRRALNENPLVQVAMIGVLAIAVGVLFLTRMSSGGSSESPPATTTSAVAEPAADPAAADPAAGSASTEAPAATPSDDADIGAAGAAGSDSGFVAGPGLPSSVVDAYEAGKTVVLLVVRTNGIDDKALQLTTRALARESDAELIVTPAKHIARYSRIASGVDVQRVPALVVISPKRLAHGGMPEASVHYGFRGAQSVVQAVKDAEYKGKTNLPYYPK